MDRMRQLVRILVKLMPASKSLLVDEGEATGNRMKKVHIQIYLDRLLLPHSGVEQQDELPPYPDWGVKEGWPTYLSSELSAGVLSS
jgi:hypothetical protein